MLRRILVVAEVALALTLLVGAGLLIRSFALLQGVNPGFDPRNLVTVNVSLPEPSTRRRIARARSSRRCGCGSAGCRASTSVGATSNIPFGGNWSTGSFNVEGYQPPEGQPGPWGDQRLVTPGFSRGDEDQAAQRAPFIAPTTAQGAPKVVVVDDEMVKRYWPNSDPIGKRITFDETTDAAAEWITVIGVVGHTAHEGLDAERRVQLYRPCRSSRSCR